VIECPVPVNVSAIFGDFLREKINKNGCCGAAELIKLNSYRLTQYARVVHLDADVLLYKGFPELFSFPHSLIYTTDPNMATHKGPDKQPVQGGFIVIKVCSLIYLFIDLLIAYCLLFFLLFCSPFLLSLFVCDLFFVGRYSCWF
jgi:hypothetical protein